MIALTSIIYLALIMVFYKTLKVRPNPKNIATFVVIGILLIGSIVVVWQFASPSAGNLVVARFTIPLVPQVKGPVSKIHAQPNVPLRKGKDILFEIQRDPYEFALSQAQGAFDAANKNIEQLQAGIQAAAAATRKSAASLAAAKAELDVARETEQLNPDAISKLRVVQLTEQFNAAEAALQQAEAVEDQAKLTLESSREQLVSLQAQVDTAEFNLQQCTVYAPADGFVTQWVVREGTMAVALPFSPVGNFIDTTETVLVASFPQNVVRFVKRDDPVEVTLRSRPGQVFAGKVEDIIQATGEGQLASSESLVIAADIESKGKFSVKFSLDDENVSRDLAIGTAGTVAIYTDKGKPFQIISKVTVRINAWKYYFLPF